MKSFSQIDTSKICFSYNTAKLIATDLIKGDSAISELTLTHKMVWQLNEKIHSQDSIINLYIYKEENYINQLNKYNKIQNTQSQMVSSLEKDVTKLTRKNHNLKTGIKWLSGGFVASVLTIVTFIVIK